MKEQTPKAPQSGGDDLGSSEDMGFFVTHAPELIAIEAKRHEAAHQANKRLAIRATIGGAACATLGAAAGAVYVAHRRHNGRFH